MLQVQHMHNTLSIACIIFYIVVTYYTYVGLMKAMRETRLDKTKLDRDYV